MEEIKALQAVYSYMFPEVKKVIFDTLIGENLWGKFYYSHDNLQLCSSDPQKLADLLKILCFEEMQTNFLSHFLQSPEQMDNMHIPIFDKWIYNHKNLLLGINKFNYIYPTAGSEEGIREFMTYLLWQGVTSIYVLKGEYEGYRFVGGTRGFRIDNKSYNIKTVEVDLMDIEKIDRGWFFISNPSARDGNFIHNDYINKICNAGHKVFYDLAYVDAAYICDSNIDLTHENIKAVVMSYSKPYGLFYFRFGGLLSREEVPSLDGNKWFKVVPSILIANNIMDRIKPFELVNKYKKIQKKIVQNMISEYDLPLSCSDAVILAYINTANIDKIPHHMLPLIEKYKRADRYRFCLKPYFEEWENKRAIE